MIGREIQETILSASENITAVIVEVDIAFKLISIATPDSGGHWEAAIKCLKEKFGFGEGEVFTRL